ncbi:hypothetical protein M9H77_13777 [Catharanthus roseus]|uniref:Uncharacterized protein n=1 Tax=Catharanthus roseus TaxID=4058 RepID=A0ACC0BLA5_CATRO|nr:hypothetical protein M9H77_13777 [Catharanthus roseus]
MFLLSAESLEHYTRTCCRGKYSLPSGWDFHNVGIHFNTTTWFNIAIAHNFESHDDITKEHFYHNIFVFHFGRLADLLHIRPIAHAIWDPHFCQPAVEAFTRGGALGQMNIAYSSWLHIQPKWKPSFLFFPNANSRLYHYFLGLFSISSLVWIGHFVHVTIPRSRGEVRSSFYRSVESLYSKPQFKHLWLTDIAHHHLVIALIFLIASQMYRTNFGIGHNIKAFRCKCSSRGAIGTWA